MDIIATSALNTSPKKPIYYFGDGPTQEILKEKTNTATTASAKRFVDTVVAEHVPADSLQRWGQYGMHPEEIALQEKLNKQYRNWQLPDQLERLEARKQKRFEGDSSELPDVDQLELASQEAEAILNTVAVQPSIEEQKEEPALELPDVVQAKHEKTQEILSELVRIEKVHEANQQDTNHQKRSALHQRILARLVYLLVQSVGQYEAERIYTAMSPLQDPNHIPIFYIYTIRRYLLKKQLVN